MADETAGSRARNEVALAEIWNGISRWEFWLTLAWTDIRGRYRRTLLGPFWSVLNSILFISILATVYSLLWRIDLGTFLPFVAAGYFVWIFFASCIGECCSIFHAYGETLKTMPLPPMAMLVRVIIRNLMVFSHNLLVFVVIALCLGMPLAYVPLALPGLAFVALTALGLGTALAFLCARFRDFEQIVQSLLQILFYISPILWLEKLLPEHATWLAQLNPIYHLLRNVRDPMLGSIPPYSSYFAAAVVTAASLAIGLWAYLRFRDRLAFWL